LPVGPKSLSSRWMPMTIRNKGQRIPICIVLRTCTKLGLLYKGKGVDWGFARTGCRWRHFSL